MDFPRFRIAGVLLTLVLILLPAAAQDGRQFTFDEEAEALFDDGLTLFQEGRLREATTAFDLIIARHPHSHRITAAFVMKAKSLYRQYENLEAARTLKTFLSRFEQSRYVADAHLALGRVYRRIGRLQEALDEFREAWGSLPQPEPERLRADILAALDAATLGVGDQETLRLLDGSSRPDERAYFWLRIAELEITRLNVPAAAAALDSLTTRYPGAPFAERITAVQDRITRNNSFVIGVLVPLMRNAPPSVVQELGNEVYEGVAYAAEQALADPGMRVRVQIDTRDTQRDPRLAAAEVTAFAEDPSVIGIVGPVFSSTALEAAAAARDGGIPMVTPTANANGIAAIGPTIFQLNPDYDARGRAMARYGILRRGFSTFGVLAPTDTYARQLAEGFISEALALGATVVSTEWYERGTSDLTPQLARMRRAAMTRVAEPLIPFGGKLRRAELMKLVDLGVPLRRIDSLMAHGSEVPAGILLGVNARHIIDSLQLSVAYDESRIDSLEYPANGLDAIYAPISGPDEIGVVSSQVVYFHFDAQLLGSGEWNNPAELFASKRYCEGMIFETDSFVDTASASYRAFADGFAARFRKQPSRNTLFGYDAMECVLMCIRNGAGTRDALARALSRVDDFRGLHSPVGFTAGRVNGWLTIVEYALDAVRRLDEIRVE